MIRAFFFTLLALLEIEIPFVTGRFDIYATIDSEPIRFEQIMLQQPFSEIVFEKDSYIYRGHAERDSGSTFLKGDPLSTLFAFILNPLTQDSWDIWLHGYIMKDNNLVGFWSGYKEDYLCQPKTNWLREIYLIFSKTKMF